MPGYKRKYGARGNTRGRPYGRNPKRRKPNLRKQVAGIKRTQDLNKEKLTFRQYGSNAIAASYHFSSLLITPGSSPGNPAWGSIFRNNINADESNSLLVKKLYCEYSINTGNEVDQVDCTVFMLTPKSKKVHKETYNTATGALSLTPNVDYVMTSGMALINKARWKIWHFRRIRSVSAVGGNGSNIVNVPLPRQIGHIRKSFGQKGWRLGNTQGAWTSLDATDLPHYMQARYVVFNNNASTVEGSPIFSHNTLITAVAGG